MKKVVQVSISLVLTLFRFNNAPLRKIESPKISEYERQNNMSSEEQQPPIPDWSHLVGQHVSFVSSQIASTHPHLQIQTVAPGALVTRDFRTDRLRLYHDAQGTVTSKPNVG